MKQNMLVYINKCNCDYVSRENASNDRRETIQTKTKKKEILAKIIVIIRFI